MISTNALLGMLFLALGFITTYLMFHFWGYPYDEDKKQSSCPQWKMNIHRGFGFAYVVVYVLLMIEMVPRMWTYQVEFPARTVLHMVAGISIGFILLLKISILRFFRHLEEWMPVLGTLLLWFTVLLAGLSFPFVFAEQALASDIEMTAEANERVKNQLARIEFEPAVNVEKLASSKSLGQGRQVLLEQCVFCHDLKTAIAKPRTSGNWWKTVQRMAEKPSFGRPLSLDDQQLVTAYLVAITPDLQDSSARRREISLAKKATRAAMPETPIAEPDGDAGVEDVPVVDMAKATEVYEELCSECHDLEDVDADPPGSLEDIQELLVRMIENDLVASEEELRLVTAYLMEAFVNKEEK